MKLHHVASDFDYDVEAISPKQSQTFYLVLELCSNNILPRENCSERLKTEDNETTCSSPPVAHSNHSNANIELLYNQVFSIPIHIRYIRAIPSPTVSSSASSSSSSLTIASYSSYLRSLSTGIYDLFGNDQPRVNVTFETPLIFQFGRSRNDINSSYSADSACHNSVSGSCSSSDSSSIDSNSVSDRWSAGSSSECQGVPEPPLLHCVRQLIDRLSTPSPAPAAATAVAVGAAVTGNDFHTESPCGGYFKRINSHINSTATDGSGSSGSIDYAVPVGLLAHGNVVNTVNQMSVVAALVMIVLCLARY